MKPTRAPTALETVLAYHERTKHHPDRYARSLGYLDWDTQPDPFRRYEGAEVLLLDEVPPTPEPVYDDIFTPGGAEPPPLDRACVSQLFYDSLALSAWKEFGPSRWSLRVNPSSGNLHPTEGYLLAGAIPGFSATPALYHYSPFLHGLERRAALPVRDWLELTRELPPGTLLLGLTSIHWRESWKYGERAFRYCHQDVGHAIAAVALAAAALGRNADLLEGWSDPELSVLLGVAGQRGAEAEHPDCLIGIYPASGSSAPERSRVHGLSPDLRGRLTRIPMSGEPNRLSREHHPWPVIDEAAEASARAEPPPGPYWESRPEKASRPWTRSRRISARQIIRQRRSAVAMDGQRSLERDAFYGMLGRVLPGPSRVPFRSLPWKPALHLVLFVHRVEGLDPGMYCLIRDPDARDDVKAAMHPGFEWARPAGCPEELPLYVLVRGDGRNAAQIVSCHQEIAADGAFAAAMIAEFEPLLQKWGPWFYKRLHWEAGAIGQVLYLEAEAAGVGSTGMGCFFDDALHGVVGLAGIRYQDLYHFTVGGPVLDTRLRTTPAYAHRRNPREEERNLVRPKRSLP